METEDGNEDVCGACTEVGDLICCERCPAAYHAECAGYASSEEVPAGDWFCWSCCLKLRRPFAYPKTRFSQAADSIVYVAIDDRLDTFYQARLDRILGDQVSVVYTEAVHGRPSQEHISRRTHRLWHGTAKHAAWEKGIGQAEWHPFSRRYAIRMPGASPSPDPPPKEQSPPQPTHSQAPGQHAQHSRPVGQHAQHSMTSSLPVVQPVPYMVPVAIPTRPAAVPVTGAAAAPRSIFVGNFMGGHGYSSESLPIGSAAMLPAMASTHASGPFQMPRPSQAPARPSPEKPARRRGRPLGSGNSARKRARHSSSSESSDSTSGFSDNDNSDDSSGAIRQRRRKLGSPADEALFMSALTQFLEGQGDPGKKLLRKHRHLDALNLYSGMPPVNVYHLWLAGMSVGGHAKATANKLWAAVGRLFKAPQHMTTMSHTFKAAYAKLLLPFEEATRKGQTGIPVPPVTNKLPTLADLRSLSAGAATSEEASYTQSDSEPDSPAPRDRMKYLTILEEARGGARDFGESPVKRGRLEQQGIFDSPAVRPLDNQQPLVEALVASHPVPSQLALELAPGSAVEYRSRHPYFVGGWFRAKVLQLGPGSAAEGGRRFLLECVDFDAERGPGNLQEWVPLVYPDANAAVPYVLIRLPSEPEMPPAPAREWAAGDRCEGFWQNAWWISTVKEVEDDGTVVCLSDSTPVYPEGEEWEVEPENLRAGHPQEALGFGMLNTQLAPPALPKSVWRDMIKPRKFQLEGFVIEAYACHLHLGIVSNHVPTVTSHMGAATGPKQSPETSPDPRASSEATHSMPEGSSGSHAEEAADNSQSRPAAPPNSGQDASRALGTNSILTAPGNSIAPGSNHRLTASNPGCTSDGNRDTVTHGVAATLTQSQGNTEPGIRDVDKAQSLEDSAVAVDTASVAAAQGQQPAAAAAGPNKARTQAHVAVKQEAASLDEGHSVQQIKQEPLESAPQQQLHSRGYRNETHRIQHAGSFDPYEYGAQQAQRAMSANAFGRSLSRSHSPAPVFAHPSSTASTMVYTAQPFAQPFAHAQHSGPDPLNVQGLYRSAAQQNELYQQPTPCLPSSDNMLSTAQQQHSLLSNPQSWYSAAELHLPMAQPQCSMTQPQYFTAQPHHLQLPSDPVLYPTIQHPYAMSQPYYALSQPQNMLPHPAQYAVSLPQPASLYPLHGWAPPVPGSVHLNPHHVQQQQQPEAQHYTHHAQHAHQVQRAHHAQHAEQAQRTNSSVHYQRAHSEPLAEVRTSSGRQSARCGPSGILSSQNNFQHLTGLHTHALTTHDVHVASEVPLQHQSTQQARHAGIQSNREHHSSQHAGHKVEHSMHSHASQHAQQAKQGRELSPALHETPRWDHQPPGAPPAHSRQAKQAQHAADADAQSARLTGATSRQDHSCGAFIVWVDAHFKQTGQSAKRLELRQFVQAAKASHVSPPQLLMHLVQLVGQDLVKLWQQSQQAQQQQQQHQVAMTGNGLPSASAAEASAPQLPRPTAPMGHHGSNITADDCTDGQSAIREHVSNRPHITLSKPEASVPVEIPLPLEVP